MAYLDKLLTPDFLATSPRGFQLDKEQWLERYRSGRLCYRSFFWEDLKVRAYSSNAIAVGIQKQQANYNGTHCNGLFRGTQVFVQHKGHWKLAALQLSPLENNGSARRNSR